MSRNGRTDASAFTLVELLVVIGIIAVLVAILLPTLAAARRSANTVECLSNVRQLATAAMLFAHEHKGYLPVSSDDRWAKMRDPQRTIWAYRDDPAAVDGSKITVYDWASSLIPYLGGKLGQTFATAPEAQSKVFRCPADQWMDVTDPGYRIFQNVPPGFHAISYGYNADVSCVCDNTGVGRFGYSDSVGVYGGPTNGPGYGGYTGQPLGCKLTRISKPSEVLLYADCGTRPNTAKSGAAPLDNSDCLFYTTNYMANQGGLPPQDYGRLSGIAQTPWLKDRIPMLRHGGKKLSNGTFSNCRINVAFADGHGDTVLQSDFNQVRVSPYPLPAR
jgi:prepilin-type N-terminal cleavage/methylation domain-containing protein